MNVTPSDMRSKDIPFGDADFKAVASMAKSQFGLNLAESKKPLVYSRLSKRLKARNISGFPEYLALLSKPTEEQEKFELISALTTNVTSFFRESHHFDTLRDKLLPDLAARLKQGGRARFWSAGCSAGQEPFSMAMTVLDGIPDVGKYDFRILATDIDPKIVQKARKGEYSTDEIDSIPSNLQSKWTKKGSSDKVFELHDAARKMITFNELNLISTWPFRGPFDAIFCRNVAIYFDQETQQTLWNRFCDYLAPGGVLFIGHSERVTGPAANHLEGIGITSYQKVGNTASSKRV